MADVSARAEPIHSMTPKQTLVVASPTFIGLLKDVSPAKMPYPGVAFAKLQRRRRQYFWQIKTWCMMERILHAKAALTANFWSKACAKVAPKDFQDARIVAQQHASHADKDTWLRDLAHL